MNQQITLLVNGRRRAVETDPLRPLLDVLREDLGLTGAKYGCGEGACGACAVLIEGRRVYACGLPVGEAAGRRIVTIEGLADDQRLHPVQEAFLVEQGFQCGFCTPGMIIGAVALLGENPAPDEAQVRAWMNGHLCRCCGYERILGSIQRAMTAAGNAGEGDDHGV